MALIFLFSCSQSAEEKYEMSLRHVRQLLTDRNCGEALRITADLNSSGNRSGDPRYLYLRSSSLACNGDYDDLRFFTENFPLLNDVNDDSFHYLLASFYNSGRRPGSSEYRHLAESIDTLLFPGDITRVSFRSREELFGDRIAHNFNTQILYMLLTKLGRYSRHYGNMARNSDNQLVKGLGNQGNSCFADYTTTSTRVLRDVSLTTGNPCQGNSNGHPDLQESAENRVRIMCEGITMINTLFEIVNFTIPRIVRSDGINSLTELNQELCTNEFGNALICSVQTPSLCEDMPLEFIESFVLLYYESLTDAPVAP